MEPHYLQRLRASEIILSFASYSNQAIVLVDIIKEKRKNLEKTVFYKHVLDKLAYVSLIADVSIAIATLISLHAYSSNVDYIIKWLNYGLTLIVIITVGVFVIFAFVSNYHKRIVRLIRYTGEHAVKSVRKNRR